MQSYLVTMWYIQIARSIESSFGEHDLNHSSLLYLKEKFLQFMKMKKWKIIHASCFANHLRKESISM
jgi:hypothetical protein